jgi:hypothetical protein
MGGVRAALRARARLTIRALPSVFVVVTIASTSSAASSVSATRSGLRTDFVGAAFAGTSIGEYVRHLPIPGARNPTPKLYERPYLQPASSSPPEMPIPRRLFGVTTPVEDGAGRRATGVIGC